MIIGCKYNDSFLKQKVANKLHTSNPIISESSGMMKTDSIESWRMANFMDKLRKAVYWF